VKRLLRMSLLVAAISYLPPILSGEQLCCSQALADDDDGADDDGGDDGTTASGGGSSKQGTMRRRTKVTKYKPTQRKTKKIEKLHKAKQRQVRVTTTKLTKRGRLLNLPIAAPSQLVISDLKTEEIPRLSAAGFKLDIQFKESNGTWTARFKIPARLTLRNARNKARQLVPKAQVDYNHYFRHGYAVQAGESCNSKICKPFELVGWRSVIAQCDGLPEIGIIDTWVDASHPALLQDNITHVAIVGEIPKSAGKVKGSGHGTSIAALLNGRSDGPVPGLVPRAKLAVVSVFETGANGDERTDAFKLVAALNALEQRGTKIINMSLAGPPNSVLEKTLTDLATSGTIVIAASGNAGPSAGPAYPAAYPVVIAVTAVSETLKVYRRAGRGQHIDISAPGVSVPSAGQNNTIELFTGSSFAVPFVTAAIAVQLSGKSRVLAGDINANLKKSALDLGEPGVDNVFGAGLLQFSQVCIP
jgi:Subtilase family